ncbi:MAG: pyruvate, phosphate dikinase [Bacteriovoracaceae bacterium]|nr:pyruvate, phosphate dikinase [Bacteriovoracaceae bacterium]
MNNKQWVYLFSKDKTDGNKDMKALLGGKGANLAEMSALGGIPVPPGFTVTTEACLDFEKNDFSINPLIKEQIEQAIAVIEKLTNKRFGDKNNPLLFSVRSGARVSMPGMMDTVLNLGLNNDSVEGMAKLTGNERFAWDAYRRFIQMYANVVMGFNTSILEATLEDLKEARNVEEDTALTASDLKELVGVYKKIILEESGKSFPLDPMDQLWPAIGAVFSSWNNPRAKIYRDLNNFAHDWGTAVNIQSMVFGNMGDDSGTGVCFTRDPSTGEKVFFGEYLMNAQGEDVVAGIRTPAPINKESKNNQNSHLATLQASLPSAFLELEKIYQKLEKHYRDMQDIEFTIEKNKLYILQTRNGKRTTAAALKIAVDLVNEGTISTDEALLRVDPEDLNQLLHPRLDPKVNKVTIAKGLPASPGAGAGEIVFDSEKAADLQSAGRAVVLVRHETSPEDIQGMVAAKGILTAKGGMTSHAAVVARGMGKPCVAGCSAVIVDYANKLFLVKGQEFKEGDNITIDGATGEIYQGIIPTINPEISDDFKTFMEWADKARTLTVRTNADNPKDSAMAVKFGAEGIGLCRTEHMFFDAERILAVREMIFASTEKDRQTALDKLLPFQREDFIGIFKAMDKKPVNIRLLDPPLHEFLPQSIEDKKLLAKTLGISLSEVESRSEYLHEFNPMLGHRGCRLGVTYPEIYRMQVRAIIEAAIICKESNVDVRPEIMIPLIATDGELKILKKEAQAVIDTVFEEKSSKIDYLIGTMIELPRAAITADQIAPHADFFSFGTNDLTQTTFGLSRDDAGKFLHEYINKGLLAKDPFVALDTDGVGFLVKHACQAAKTTNPDIHLGICGEHGGEPSSIDFCHRAGLDYVSCSPFRIPIARLAAAQSAIRNNK